MMTLIDFKTLKNEHKSYYAIDCYLESNKNGIKDKDFTAQISEITDTEIKEYFENEVSLSKKNLNPRMEEIYRELYKKYPDNIFIIKHLAITLSSKSKYTEALDLIRYTFNFFDKSENLSYIYSQYYFDHLNIFTAYINKKIESGEDLHKIQKEIESEAVFMNDKEIDPNAKNFFIQLEERLKDLIAGEMRIKKEISEEFKGIKKDTVQMMGLFIAVFTVIVSFVNLKPENQMMRVYCLEVPTFIVTGFLILFFMVLVNWISKK